MVLVPVDPLYVQYIFCEPLILKVLTPVNMVVLFPVKVNLLVVGIDNVADITPVGQLKL